MTDIVTCLTLAARLISVTSWLLTDTSIARQVENSYVRHVSNICASYFSPFAKHSTKRRHSIAKAVVHPATCLRIAQASHTLVSLSLPLSTMSFLTYPSCSTKQRHVYERLPLNAQEQHRSPSPSAPRRSQRRVRRLVTAFATTLAVVATFRVWIHELTGIPTYEDIKRYERRLPQHDLDLSLPEGRDG